MKKNNNSKQDTLKNDDFPKILPGIFPCGVDWSQYFNNSNCLDTELGFGRPHFLFDRAINFPDRNIVAMDWKEKWVKSANKRKQRDNLDNMCAVHGNAWILFGSFFKENSLSSIFINFPDPWWKKKHHKKKIINDKFVELLVSRLKKNGVIFLQSDVEHLFEEYVDILKSHKSLQIINNIEDFCAKNINAQSHREKKCLENNLAIYKIALAKQS